MPGGISSDECFSTIFTLEFLSVLRVSSSISIILIFWVDSPAAIMQYPLQNSWQLETNFLTEYTNSIRITLLNTIFPFSPRMQIFSSLKSKNVGCLFFEKANDNNLAVNNSSVKVAKHKNKIVWIKSVSLEWKNHPKLTHKKSKAASNKMTRFSQTYPPNGCVGGAR